MKQQSSADAFCRAMGELFRSLTVHELQLMQRLSLPAGLSYNSLLYLDLIWSEEGRCTVSSLADRLGVSRPGVASKVAGLVRQGYVTRTQSPDDHRVYYLAVDEERIPGYAFYRTLDRAVADDVAARYTPEEVALFCRMLTETGALYLARGARQPLPENADSPAPSDAPASSDSAVPADAPHSSGSPALSDAPTPAASERRVSDGE